MSCNKNGTSSPGAHAGEHAHAEDGRSREPAHLAKEPQAEPVSLPLLVCCVAVALVAVVDYQNNGDKTEGTSFVAWGLERRFFLQQEETSR